jgi:hypothetical protein
MSCRTDELGGGGWVAPPAAARLYSQAASRYRPQLWTGCGEGSLVGGAGLATGSPERGGGQGGAVAAAVLVKVIREPVGRAATVRRVGLLAGVACRPSGPGRIGTRGPGTPVHGAPVQATACSSQSSAASSHSASVR